MSKDEDEGGGIRITDRRVSASGGEPTEEQRREAADAVDRVAEAEEDEDVPGIDFTTFVLSLSASAAMHLGLSSNPMTGATELSLPLARQTIDLLAVLEKKTVGNLTGEEERLLSQVLYDLRMQFLAQSKG